ncbi:putative zinc-binding peptidase [Alteromonas sp. ASW11-19]|uniref:Zinc-binding peptidase n=1 Tax=Alteromonas salexigens TaxID=2982530 RepID=A0ABT2VLG4_9ALTE|nr:putative zinc-binding metallopeptidase [Alteromonas salexigens]MCU7554151.1 putative zinc-binding peptidase [Alteromonas salexigens]
MKNFTCQCGNTVYFANTKCLSCNRALGFVPEIVAISSFDNAADGAWVSHVNGLRYWPCTNYLNHHICNWVVEEGSQQSLCHSCSLTKTIPDLSRPHNMQLWFRMEQAKRRLLFTLMSLGLPIWEQRSNKPNLRFEFLEDVEEDEYGQELTVKSTVVTGHSNGMITLNLKEAEDSSRVMMREQMNERYRTLIGHFRHESGHFYWEWLIRGSVYLNTYRELFGDEREDYTASLQRYYESGPPMDWESQFISAYASAHSWEDWAESWAHYLHIIDTLDTAAQYGVSLETNEVVDPVDKTRGIDFDRLYADWCRLTTVLNALNRSMGLDDAYPFTIPPDALGKLRFIHNLIEQHR